MSAKPKYCVHEPTWVEDDGFDYAEPWSRYFIWRRVGTFEYSDGAPGVVVRRYYEGTPAANMPDVYVSLEHFGAWKKQDREAVDKRFKANLEYTKKLRAVEEAEREAEQAELRRRRLARAIPLGTRVKYRADVAKAIGHGDHSEMSRLGAKRGVITSNEGRWHEVQWDGEPHPVHIHPSAIVEADQPDGDTGSIVDKRKTKTRPAESRDEP